MAKKKTNSIRMGFLDILSKGVKSIATSVEEEMRVKEKVHHYMLSWTILGAAIFVLFYGIAVLLDSFVSGWIPGLSFIIVGLIFVLIALVYRKYY